MSNVFDFNAKHPLAGTWKCCDGESELEVAIDVKAGIAIVTVVDNYDGERPEVHDVALDASTHVLSFSTYWSSTGRFVKYQFRHAQADGRAEVTYTYTDREIWERV